jgi:farnesyl diphosphate synthase
LASFQAPTSGISSSGALVEIRHFQSYAGCIADLVGYMALAEVTPQAFESRLRAVAAATDAVLDGVLPALAGNRLRLAMRYSALGQGKRLRPFLVVESAALFAVPETQALMVGAALEALHCYSLVHDDLPAMDNDDLRRGQPTTHRKFDEATAILAGDGLLTLAFEMLADPRSAAAADVRVSLVAALAKAAGEAGMVGGQMLDIEAETAGFQSVAEIAHMQSRKTGALFRFACGAGALLAGKDPTALHQYAEHIGLAFQVADDILDVESSSAALGKATQKDKSKGKATFVDLMGLEGAKREAQRLVAEAKQALSVYGGRAAMLQATADFIITRRK